MLDFIHKYTFNEYVNIFLRYLFIPILLISIVLLVSVNLSKRTKRIRIKKAKAEREKRLRDSKVLSIPIKVISDSLSFTNSFSKKTNDLIGFIVVIIYMGLVVIVYKYLGVFSFLWYTKLVNLIVAVFLPYALIHTYISIQINTITKQIPGAFSEILSAYRSDKRIKVAIENSIEYMDKNIKREFKRINAYLSSENTFEYGLDYFSKRLNNSYVTLFTNLIKESRYKNSDITEALEKLVIKTRSKNYMKEKARRQLVWYRVFLILWLFTIPAVMKFVASASLEAYRFYNTVEGAKILTLAMISIIGGYMLIALMERV